MNRTKIVCTIGPASREPAMLEKLIGAGMNLARLNFSHGTHEEHSAMMADIRAAAEHGRTPVGILQDLQGPKIRVGELPNDGVLLTAGSEVIFSTDPSVVSQLPTAKSQKPMMKIPVGYERLHQEVKKGDRLLLDDGLIEARVEAVAGRDIVCVVVTGGTLYSHKGLNLPTASLSIPAVTEKDLADIAFGVAAHVDWIALSFVRTADDVHLLRDLIVKAESALGPEHLEERPVRIMAKIEKHEALVNIDSIIEAADGIMVARGDLGIETPAEDVPLAQKRVIMKCLAAAKPVVVATQMLDSMIRNPRPTRAEVSDVANAVIDHADAVMLSGETASGKYPLEAVETMARIIEETEASPFDDLARAPIGSAGLTADEAVSRSAVQLARESSARAILALTPSGETARLLSRERPELPIIAVTADPRVQGQLTVSWGVLPLLLPVPSGVEGTVEESSEAWAAKAQERSRRMKLIKKSDRIVVVSGEGEGADGADKVEAVEVL